ncbi:Ger(x)C family spore germination protein [Paenibacillus hemerocallicola]|uniref:Ger(X)C family spore germination protein n=1 Tax=Paenibacillus hemerocallicola TaxID=1172614 RepID=A0A5C4SY94_9BACL|nr:Ger(x)C family spore germination protein [Paenibacillus hemerocallicola]TNJ57733.1 Ger(x)C family spore germination protein [Paenibacillus hemerocallicola]
MRQAARWVMMLFIGAGALFVTGCWDRSEVNDLAIILSAGIDQDNRNGVKLSVEVYIPKSGESGTTRDGMSPSGGGGRPTLVSSATGVSLSDAMSHLQERLSRKLYWGHNHVFVIGKKRAEAGLDDDLDFVLRYPEMRERANFYITEGTAIEVMRVMPQLERSTMEALRELSKTEVGSRVDLKQLLELMSRSPDQAFYLPYVLRGSEMTDSQYARNPDVPYFKGMAVLKKGKLVGTVDNETSLGVLWLTDRIRASTLVVYPISSGSISVSLSRSVTDAKPYIGPDGKWRLDLTVHYEGDVVQNTSGLDLMKPDQFTRIVEGANETIRGRMEAALKEVRTGMKADVLDFGEAFRRKYPKQWRTAKGEWEERFKEIEISLDVKADIIRPGSITGNIPELIRKDGGRE